MPILPGTREPLPSEPPADPPMSAPMGHHANGASTDTVADLDGEWHIGRTWPGMFPAHEASCACPKAACGLVIPTVSCPEHNGEKTIRQAHRASECTRKRRNRT